MNTNLSNVSKISRGVNLNISKFKLKFDYFYENANLILESSFGKDHRCLISDRNNQEKNLKLKLNDYNKRVSLTDRESVQENLKDYYKLETSNSEIENKPSSRLFKKKIEKSRNEKVSCSIATRKVEREMITTLGLKTPDSNSVSHHSSFSNEVLLSDLTRTKFKYFVKDRINEGSQINSNTIKMFLSENKEKFQKNNVDSNLKLITNANEAHKDPLLNSLHVLDKLHKSLPNYRSKILQLKKQTTEVEKLKLIINYEKKDINNKLDTLLAGKDEKLKWEKVNFKQIEWLRNKINSLEKKEIKPEMSEAENNYLYYNTFKSKIKPKFRKVGENLKLLILPKELIYDPNKELNEKILYKNKMKKEIQKIIKKKKINLIDKKFLDNIAKPKKCKQSELEKLASECEKLCDKNLRLQNKIIDTIKVFKKDSLYMNPKSALINTK
jgi:hypothetical protein